MNHSVHIAFYITVFTSLLILQAPLTLASPTNDNLENAIKIDGFPFVYQQNTLNAGTESSEVTPSCVNQTGASVWYQYTPIDDQQVTIDTFSSTYDTVLSLWKGDEYHLTAIICNDDANNTNEKQSQIITHLEKNMTYYINVSDYAAIGGNLVIQANVIDPLINDDLAGAINITTADSNKHVQAITDATIEPDEASPTCAPYEASVWYRYTAPVDQKVTFDTIGSNYDTVLSLWTGAGHPLTEVTCNDDDHDNAYSQLGLFLKGGVTYHVNIARVSDSRVNSNSSLLEKTVLILNTTVIPINDDVTDAIHISSPLPYTNTQSTLHATDELVEAYPSCTPSSRAGVWYQYTPLISETVSFSTLGSDYDTVLSIWMGEGYPTIEIGCNDDAATSNEQELTSKLNVLLDAGITYFIKIGRSQGKSGHLVLNLDHTINDLDIIAQPLDQILDKGQRAALTIQVTGTMPLSYQWYEGYQGDMSIPHVNTDTFTTPTLHKTTRYWVRVTNSTGHIDSRTVVVHINGTTNGVGVNAQGLPIEITANFMSVITTESDLIGNDLTLTQKDSATVTMKIEADKNHVDEQVTLLIFAYYDDGKTGRTAYMLGEDGGWKYWNGHLIDLVAAQTALDLRQVQTLTLFQGPLADVLPVTTSIYVGYRSSTDDIVYSSEPIHFSLK